MKVNNAYSQSCATCCRRFGYLFFSCTNGVDASFGVLCIQMVCLSRRGNRKKKHIFFSRLKRNLHEHSRFHFWILRSRSTAATQLRSIQFECIQSVRSMEYVIRWEGVFHLRYALKNHSCGSLNGYKRCGARRRWKWRTRKKSEVIKKNDCVASWLGIFNFPLCTICVWNEWRRWFLGRSGIR